MNPNQQQNPPNNPNQRLSNNMQQFPQGPQGQRPSFNPQYQQRPPLPHQQQQQPQRNSFNQQQQGNFRPVTNMPPSGQPIQPGQQSQQHQKPRMQPQQVQNRPPFPPQQAQPSRPSSVSSDSMGMQQMTGQMANMQVNDVSPSGGPPKPGRRAYPSQQLMEQAQQHVSPQSSFPGSSMPPMPAGMPPQPQYQGGSGQFNQVPPTQHQMPPQQQMPLTGPFIPQGMVQSPQFQQQQKPKIDPDQIPSPVTGQMADHETWKVAEYTSLSDLPPPLASSDYIAMDNGNATCRFIRSTSYCVPCTSEVANSCQIPVALVVQPLAELKPQETPVECVDFGAAEGKGPIRCTRCKAYINLNFSWLNGGRRFACNICEFVNDTPDDYFCPLDQNGYRLDWAQRPELRFGVVDFKATKEYCARAPVPASFLFVVDVSYPAVQAGVLGAFIEAVKEVLDFFPMAEDSDESPCSIGLITFDKNVHFYNLSPELSQPSMLVVSDINDVFVPLEKGLLVRSHESRDILEKLFLQLHVLHSHPRPSNENCFGVAMKAAQMALKKTGGRIIALNHSLPTLGPGSLKTREELKLINTENEKQLFIPQDNYYMKLAEECTNVGASVDLFLFPTSYIDLASIGVLSSLTGGRSILYPRFHQEKDGYTFTQDLQRAILRPFGYDSVMRVRCGNGLQVEEHFGNFLMRNATDIEMALVDSETAFAVKFRHDGQIPESKKAQFQIAVLYTTSLGERRIRVLNLALRTSMQVGQIFRNAEIDATLNFLTKAVVSKASSMSLKNIRDVITEKCVKILAAYRKVCATSSPPGQLILPDSFKLYPVYALSILKSRAFKAATDLSSDMRVEEMRALRSLNVATSITFFYPRMFSLHNMNEKCCDYDENNKFAFPPRLRCSREKIQPNGMYLLENTRKVIIYIGAQIPSKYLEMLFGVPTIQEVNPMMRILPKLENEFSKQVRELLYYIQEEQRKGQFPGLQIVRQGEPTEELMKLMLVEDDGYESMNYVDYLCFVHRQIQNSLSD